MRKTLSVILLLVVPVFCFAQVRARYDISEVTYVDDSTWYVYGEIFDPTGSYNAGSISVGDRIIQRGFDSTGVTVYDRFRIVVITTDDVMYLGANVRYDETGSIKNNAGTPLTGSFPIGAPADSSDLTYKPSWYQYDIDPDYDAGIDNMNLRNNAFSVTHPLTYSHSVFGIDSTKRSMSPQVISLKAAGIVSDADLSLNSSTFGTDQTTAIQTILDKASSTNPLYVIWDVKVSVIGLNIRSYTYIHVIPNCGAILRSNTIRPLLRNYSRYLTTRDTCITIDGGIWNFNESGNSGNYSHVMEFWSVGDLTLKNFKVYEAKNYALRFQNMINLLIEDFIIDNDSFSGSTGSDGIHLRGWNKNITIRNGTITAYDDNIAVYAEQFSGTPPSVNTSISGVVDGVYIENIRFKNSLNGIKLISGTYKIDNVYINNVSGSTRVYGMIIDRWWLWSGQLTAGNGNFGNVTVENFNVTLGPVSSPYTNAAIIMVGGSAKKLIFKDIKRETYIVGENVKTIKVKGMFKFHPTIDNLIIDGYDANDTVLTTDNISHISVDSCDVKNLVVNRANLSIKNAAESGSSLIHVGSYANVGKIQLNGVIADKTYNILLNESTVDTILATNIIHTNADTSFKTNSTINTITLSNYIGSNALKGTFTNQDGDGLTGPKNTNNITGVKTFQYGTLKFRNEDDDYETTVLNKVKNGNYNLHLPEGSGTVLIDSTTQTITGTKYFTGKLHGGYGASTGAAALELGQGRTGNGSAYIDLHGDTTNSDFGLRIIRNNTGVNASSEYINKGDGDVKFASSGVGNFVFRSAAADRMTITSTGKVGIGTTSPQHKLVTVLSSGDTYGINAVFSSVNKRRDSYTQAIDTSSYNLSFSSGGAPLFSIVGKTGNPIMSTDSVGLVQVPKLKLPSTDTTGTGSTANIGALIYYNGHIYCLTAGSPPAWKQLDN